MADSNTPQGLTPGEAQDKVSPEEIQKLYDSLFALIEKATSDLFRETLEALREINPKLEVVSQRCKVFIEILVNAGEVEALDMSDAIHAIQEAADAVEHGDNRDITACALRLRECTDNFRRKAKATEEV